LTNGEVWEIKDINKPVLNRILFALEKRGWDQDRRSLREIRDNINGRPVFSPEEFAFECFYVVCVAGFKQDYAKAVCDKIINFINLNGGKFELDDLLLLYKNKNKVKAIKNIWDNRQKYCEKFYSLQTPDEKVSFLGTLPHIGNITKYHLARNLGLNFVKYDIWVQRLGAALCGKGDCASKVNNSKLDPEVKSACDAMFAAAARNTGERVGFIDVALWRACQKGLLKIKKNGKVFLEDLGETQPHAFYALRGVPKSLSGTRPRTSPADGDDYPYPLLSLCSSCFRSPGFAKKD
jgi:hypothetical protein